MTARPSRPMPLHRPTEPPDTEAPAPLFAVLANEGRRPATPAPIDVAGFLPPSGDRRLLDALGVAMYTVDAAGEITYFNEAAAQFWGRRPVLGELWCGSLQLLFPDERPMRPDECPMAIALRERRPVRGGEAIAVRPDGSKVRFLAYPTPLFDDDGTLVGAVNMLVDVSERHRLQEEARSVTRALAASNAVKDDFLGLVSHELRTPVTTIYGNARLLQARADDLDASVKASMLADMAEEADRLHTIIENLLYLTRLGSGTPLDLEPIVLDRTVERIVRSFRLRHRARDVRLANSVVSALVQGDESYMAVLIENLLSNADKYSQPDQPIDVRVSADDDAVSVVVADRGIGLGDEPVDALFEPFYRSQGARLAANGLGIGLALCQRIVAALGGRIWANRREGGGAEIGFALPIQRFREDLG
jgi:PAS domain S-box-containing protein